MGISLDCRHKEWFASIFSSQKLLNLKIYKKIYKSLYIESIQDLFMKHLSLFAETLWNPSKDLHTHTHTASTKLAAAFTSRGCCDIFRLWNAHCEGFLLTQRSGTAWYIWKPPTGQHWLPLCRASEEKSRRHYTPVHQVKPEYRRQKEKKHLRSQVNLKKNTKPAKHWKNNHPEILNICTVLISTLCISIAFTACVSST